MGIDSCRWYRGRAAQCCSGLRSWKKPPSGAVKCRRCLPGEPLRAALSAECMGEPGWAAGGAPAVLPRPAAAGPGGAAARSGEGCAEGGAEWGPSLRMDVPGVRGTGKDRSAACCCCCCCCRATPPLVAALLLPLRIGLCLWSSPEGARPRWLLPLRCRLRSSLERNCSSRGATPAALAGVPATAALAPAAAGPAESAGCLPLLLAANALPPAGCSSVGVGASRPPPAALKDTQGEFSARLVGLLAPLVALLPGTSSRGA